MTATAIITELKNLPFEERKRVFDYLCEDSARSAPSVRYADQAEALAVVEEVFSKNEELFRKLAQ